ncbi:efflux transporter outer membrane subunit [Nevskia ramosa]|uniref:efflux transporter outer membrane subunit n=1 Tax=Nevskia ramosa TaxID=64002 RepID=UPI0023521D91|nr:efflux transporter outer membrane subunit [Nevskia ramosa]
MKNFTCLTFAAAALLLAGCSLTPTLTQPELPLPERYAQASDRADEASAEAVPVAPQWWQRFGSAELDQLMTEALAANHDLAAALARIEQSRASARAARANLVPLVTGSASASTSRSGGNDTSENSQATLSASYELDLWGANRATAAAARARLDASGYNGNAVALVLQGDVASNYFLILSLKDRLVLTEENRAAAAELLRLVQLRYDNGGANALELAQQRTTLLNIEASLPSLRLSLEQTHHALAVLLGRAPGGFTVTATTLAGLNVPEIAVDTPASLLLQRPDIRASESSLIAANADIGVARAALLPSVSLSASAGFNGLITSGSSTLLSLAASLSQTIFNGGRLQSQVRIAEAQQRELVENYAQTVLLALKDVEDNLVAVGTNEQRAALLQQSTEQARLAYQLARTRYDAGADDLLTLLDAQRTRLSSEDSLVQASLAQQTAAIGLFKALGGGY